jgi:hypothetical protein
VRGHFSAISMHREERNLAALIIAAIETVAVTARSMICKQMSRILILIVLLDEIFVLILDAFLCKNSIR